MFLSFSIALGLVQAVVVERAPAPADAPMAAELVERPAGVANEAFLRQLVDEAGASGWEQVPTLDVPWQGVDLRVIGYRRVQGDGLMLFARVDGTGHVCRIRRVREGAADAQRDQLIDYCLAALTGAH